MKEAPSFNEIIGGVLAFVGVGVIAYLAVASGSEQAEGALIALLAAAVGWVYRGKVQNPDQGQVTLQSGPPGDSPTATVHLNNPPA